MSFRYVNWGDMFRRKETPYFPDLGDAILVCRTREAVARQLFGLPGCKDGSPEQEALIERGVNAILRRLAPEPIADRAPLGLDDPGPILVWRTGVRFHVPLPRVRVYMTEAEAITLRAQLLSDPRYEPLIGTVAAVAIDEAKRLARQAGASTLCVWGDGRVIEEYPL